MNCLISYKEIAVIQTVAGKKGTFLIKHFKVFKGNSINKNKFNHYYAEITPYFCYYTKIILKNHEQKF